MNILCSRVKRWAAVNDWKARCPIAAKLIIMIYLIQFFLHFISFLLLIPSLVTHKQAHTYVKFARIDVSCRSPGSNSCDPFNPSSSHPLRNMVRLSWWETRRQDTYYAPVCGNYRENLTVCVWMCEREMSCMLSIQSEQKNLIIWRTRS